MIYHLKEWLEGNRTIKREVSDDKGGTMRLGAYDALLASGSQVADIYGTTTISERHRHRYEVDIAYRDKLETCGLHFSGLSPDGRLPEIVEIPGHPWYIGVQFHPELKSKPFEPAPALRRLRARRARKVAAGVTPPAAPLGFSLVPRRPRPRQTPPA